MPLGILTGVNDVKEDRRNSGFDPGFEKSADLNNYLIDQFFGIHLKNPKISRSMFEGYCAGGTKLRLSNLKSMAGKEVKDWITCGVIVEKSEVRKSANGKDYAIWKLHDLKDVQQNPVKVLLFGEAAGTHWKLPTGETVALVCPAFTEDQGNSQQNQKAGAGQAVFKKNSGPSLLTLKLMKANQVIQLGASAHYAICKSFRQDGLRCSNFVNTSLSEVCIFHVTTEARRLAARRGTFSSPTTVPKSVQQAQSQISGVSSPNLYIRNSPNVSGAQKFSIGQSLNSSGTMRVSSANEAQKRPDLKQTTAEEEKKTLEEIVQSRPLSLSSRIMKRAVDSKNLAKAPPPSKSPLSPSKLINSLPYSQRVKEEKSAEKEERLEKEKKPASFAEFLKEASKNSPKPSVPKLAAGAHSPRGSRSSVVTLERSPQKKLNSNDSPGPSRQPILLDEKAEAAKRRAIAVLKRKAAEASQAGPSKFQQIADGEDGVHAKRIKLDTVDTTKLDELLKRRPIGYKAVEKAENEELQQRLSKMEEREKVESFMTSTMAVKNVKVVTCKECNYTAQKAADYCKERGHTLNWSKAEKRFFKCKSCRARCVAYGFLPTKRCKTCGDKGEWERVAMCDERKVKLENENLELRGEERKFIN